MMIDIIPFDDWAERWAAFMKQKAIQKTRAELEWLHTQVQDLEEPHNTLRKEFLSR
jgi:hypothetical protein